LNWGYVGQSVYGAANAMSFGTLDEATATVQYAAGGLSTDQYGNRLAVGALMNFVSAATLPAGANIDVGAAASQASVYAGGFWEGLNTGGQGVYVGSIFGSAQGVAKSVLAAARYARVAAQADMLAEDLAELDPHDAAYYSAPHGNSLESLAPARGYILVDADTLEPLKYGMTTLGEARYSESWLAANNATLKFVAEGSVAEMRAWETNQILDYLESTGQRPPLNFSNH
jgi:hypothetical protein